MHLQTQRNTPWFELYSLLLASMFHRNWDDSQVFLEDSCLENVRKIANFCNVFFILLRPVRKWKVNVCRKSERGWKEKMDEEEVDLFADK